MLDQTRKDFLTGFILRETLNPFLDNLIIQAKAQNKFFSIAVIDLDRFKKFNDKFGHIFGDEILKYAAATLRLTFSETQAYFFRYGGDEFVAVFPDSKPQETFRLMRQCGYNLAHRPFLFKNKLYPITLSSGISNFPSDAQEPDDLIKKADVAMYYSKRHGRNLVSLYNKITFLKLRRILAQIISVIIILVSAFIFYQTALKKFIQPALGQIKKMRITTTPRDLDKIVLKSGTVFEGRILAEDDKQVILSLYLGKEEGTMAFAKKEIVTIEYGHRK